MKKTLIIALIICGIFTSLLLFFLGIIILDIKGMMSVCIEKYNLYLSLIASLTCILFFYLLIKIIQNIFSDLMDAEDIEKIEVDLKKEKNSEDSLGNEYRQKLWDHLNHYIEKDQTDSDIQKNIIEGIEEDLRNEKNNKSLGEKYRGELWNQINRRAEKAKIASLKSLLNEHFKDLKDFIKNWGVK